MNDNYRKVEGEREETKDVLGDCPPQMKNFDAMSLGRQDSLRNARAN